MTAQPTARDLAREMLRQAVVDAKRQGPRQTKPRRRLTTTVSTIGRDPERFDTVLERVAAAYGWGQPSLGGQITAAWPQLVGDDTTHGTPEHYDPDTRTLHIRPVSSTAATWWRLNTPRLITTINAGLNGTEGIASIRVLPPGAQPATRHPAAAHNGTPAPTPAPAGSISVIRPAAPVEPSRGYQAAREALQATKPTNGSQDRPEGHAFAGAYGWYREPEAAFSEAVEAQRREEVRARMAGQRSRLADSA